MANIDDKKTPIGGTETPIVGRLHDASEDHVVTGANEVYDDELGERQSQINAKLKHYTKLAHYRIDAEEETREHNDDLLNNEINAKQLEIGAVETDIEPIPESPNMLPSGAIALNLGCYYGNDNPEWVYVITDGANRILAGIKRDGTIEWSAGIPSPIKNYVEKHVDELIERISALEEEMPNKVDKEEGKGLIDQEYAESVSCIDNPEYLDLVTDEDGKILEGQRKDGRKQFGSDIEVKGTVYVSSGYSINGFSCKVLEGPEWIAVWIGERNEILFGIKSDGTVDWQKGIPTHVMEKIDEIGAIEYNPEWLRVYLDKDGKVLFGIRKDGSVDWEKGIPSPIIKKIAEIATVETIPEWLYVYLDMDGKILFGIKEDGSVDWQKGVPAPIDERINDKIAEIAEFENNQEWLRVYLDEEGKILWGIRKDGSKVDNLMMYADHISAETLQLSEEGIKKLGNDIKNAGLIPDSQKKLSKVVIYGLEPGVNSTAFYIRTAYNHEKDIILRYYINGNLLISPHSAYIGNNSLSDSAIMSQANCVSTHTDSTAPLYRPESYWALFTQHGYVIPVIENTTGMTSEDVNAEWEDQLNRHYIIGRVTATEISLLPVIYQDASGHDVRDWVGPNVSTPITALTHVSGGTHTTSITVSNMRHTQLYPIMTHNDRKYFADGVEITEPGTYYCDEFSVSDSQIGYDPASVSDWFGNAGKPDLTGADIMTRFTWSYNFFGAQCCVNTTISLEKETEFKLFGGTQQEFFIDSGDYKAMFMIPKAAAQNNVELDKPFYSPSLSSTSYSIFRTADNLKNIDDPVDRQIGYLYNPNNGDYKVGMAAGLSLVSGDTIKSKRIENCKIGDNNDHYRLLLFSPPNTNKFYISAFNASPYGENDYYFPATLFKEVNYYVSYFDPSENTGQVYWYKDGNSFVVYAHCQSIESRLPINVPGFMEGMQLSVVEKTDDSELLTDTIHNGKFFVNFTSDDANYIVLRIS